MHNADISGWLYGNKHGENTPGLGNGGGNEGKMRWGKFTVGKCFVNEYNGLNIFKWQIQWKEARIRKIVFVNNF